MRSFRVLALALVLSAVGMPPATAATPTCFGQRATIVGTAGHDTLVGTAGDDVIVGLGGDDTISGGRGADRLCGGGNGGYDKDYGGRGADRISVRGYETANAPMEEHYARAIGGRGADRIRVRGFYTTGDGRLGNDSIRGNGAHFLWGGRHDDTIVAVHQPFSNFWGGGGDDAMIDTTGQGLVSYGGAPRPIRANLETGVVRGFGRDVIKGMVQFRGSQHGDVIIGSEAADDVDGAQGQDRIRGRGGDDELIGGDGDDTLRGGPDQDTLRGYEGSDVLYGGDGADILSGYWLMRSDDAAADEGDTDVLFGGALADQCYAGEDNHECEITD